MSGRSGHYYKAIRDAAKQAGWEFSRPNNGHDIYERDGQTIPLPRKLDCPKKFQNIRRALQSPRPR